jgi:hypothetical protein
MAPRIHTGQSLLALSAAAIYCHSSSRPPNWPSPQVTFREALIESLIHGGVFSGSTLIPVAVLKSRRRPIGIGGRRNNIGLRIRRHAHPSWTSTPLSGTREQLVALPPRAKTFIATNQTGPVLDAALKTPKYPTVEQIFATFRAGLNALGWRPQLLLNCRYSSKEGTVWWRAESAIAAACDHRLAAELGILPCQTSIQPQYRKPESWMLSIVKRHFADDALVYVGDMDADCQAATVLGDSSEGADSTAASTASRAA